METKHRMLRYGAAALAGAALALVVTLNLHTAGPSSAGSQSAAASQPIATPAPTPEPTAAPYAVDDLALDAPNAAAHDNTITAEQAAAIWAQLAPVYRTYILEIVTDSDLGERTVTVEAADFPRTYYECINTDYPTIASRKQLIHSLFSEDYADLLIQNYFYDENAQYLEQDGVLYRQDMAYIAIIPTEDEGRLIAATDDSFVLELHWQHDSGTSPMLVTFVLEDGEWKIDYILR